MHPAVATSTIPLTRSRRLGAPANESQHPLYSNSRLLSTYSGCHDGFTQNKVTFAQFSEIMWITQGDIRFYQCLWRSIITKTLIQAHRSRIPARPIPAGSRARLWGKRLTHSIYPHFCSRLPAREVFLFPNPKKSVAERNRITAATTQPQPITARQLYLPIRSTSSTWERSQRVNIATKMIPTLFNFTRYRGDGTHSIEIAVTGTSTPETSKPMTTTATKVLFARSNRAAIISAN